LTDIDIYAERVGIQTKGYDPLEPLKSVLPLRFVDNAFARPATPRTARCVVWMLANCDGARAWRKSRPNEDDPWLAEFQRRALQRDEIILDPKYVVSGSPPPRAWIVKQDVDAIATLSAEAACKRLRLSGSQRRECKIAIAASIHEQRASMAKSFGDWLRFSEGFLNVRVREMFATSVPEGVLVKQTKISVLRDSPAKGKPFHKALSPHRVKRIAGVIPFKIDLECIAGEDLDAEKFGDSPTPAEFLDALSFFFDLPDDVRTASRIQK